MEAEVMGSSAFFILFLVEFSAMLYEQKVNSGLLPGF
jgi:hypothetical protein